MNKATYKPLKRFLGPRLQEFQTRIAESVAVRYHHSRFRGERLEDRSIRQQRHHNMRHRYVRSPTIAFAVTEQTSTTLAGDAFSAMGLATALQKLGWTSLFLPQRPHNRWFWSFLCSGYSASAWVLRRRSSFNIRHKGFVAASGERPLRNE